MLQFVNAKINIGLNITSKRADGYHNLETCFYPVGKFNGTPENPESFDDVLEITPGNSLRESAGIKEAKAFTHRGITFVFSGNAIDCPPESNLVVKAADTLLNAFPEANDYLIAEGLTVRLMKMLPDGAGMGGGSADAAFLLRMLRDFVSASGCVAYVSDDVLERLALSVGADCPFFIRNVPAYAEGVGERLESLPEFLSGYWCVIVKPAVSISTRRAFSGVTPKSAAYSLKEALRLPVTEWKNIIHNDFEDSLFPGFPILSEIKDGLYATGALYASLTGSGAALYGLYPDAETARKACAALRAVSAFCGCYFAVCKL